VSVPPAQLPSDLPVFAGRQELIEDITAVVAATLAGEPVAQGQSRLSELVRTGLLSRYRPRR
jgi:hypothetical protein